MSRGDGERPQPPAPERVVVLRALRGLGDLIVGGSALRALRGTYPAAHLTLIGHPWVRPSVLSEEAGGEDRVGAGVDEFVVFPGVPGIYEVPLDVRRLPGFFAGMQARRSRLAATVGTASVVVFTASDPDRWIPPGPDHLAVGRPFDCWASEPFDPTVHCLREACLKGPGWGQEDPIVTQSPADVLAAADGLLEGRVP